MQVIQQKHAQAVYEAHILALKTLTDLLQRETDPIEQRRISAIILRTKPTPPSSAEQRAAMSAPSAPGAKPPSSCSEGEGAHRSGRADEGALTPFFDLDDEHDEVDDLDADLKPFNPRDLETLRQLMAATATPPTPPSDRAGEHHPSS
ncbi:MAG: hypothetical protein QM783_19065 [Phycisphaerales bacterium]